MTEKYMKKAGLGDLRKMKEQGETKPSFKAEAAPDLPKSFWDDAELVNHTITKEPISLRVDSDILEFFKAQGKGHLTRMNAVLRSYVEAQRSKTPD
ncbi:BrnA antitoxin family protein [Hoeflea sp. YIM 152468]|uniref:BrnA antitoxin family protein n=1 Tax=Hoeflea sp. YIM 152468 TaxID=3031759 RepID=UPI0023DB133A|nr:BrnA antitoxin family protein [Hoeflea sp. YIM 152468]MDF1608229.1 BrnA antitoxin family protein [Hoeflea sp. YIM 152468]